MVWTSNWWFRLRAVLHPEDKSVSEAAVAVFHLFYLFHLLHSTNDRLQQG
jgi:hypothetical protein